VESKLIADVEFTLLRQIEHPSGDVLHALKASEKSFKSFGEAYFSSVKMAKVKGWKKHKEMTLNLIVPTGAVRFVLLDDRPKSPTYNVFNEFILSRTNYARLTVPPGVWVAFQGKTDQENILLNLASIEHDPSEAESKKLEDIPFDWET